MSERGSFVTEFIYCKSCFDAAKTVLLKKEKHLCSTVIPRFSGKDSVETPIIAGKVSGLHEGEEIDTFKFEFIPALGKVICHQMRVFVMAESGAALFVAEPGNAADSDPIWNCVRR